METFNLNHVVERFALNSVELPRVLFPNAMHPSMALNRVLKNGLPLSTDQISRLAAYIGVPVSELFEYENGWKATTEDGCLTFKKGEYTVRLNYGGVFVTVLKNGEVVDTVVQNPNVMTVSEFISIIDCLILK